jgi:ribosomal protein S18 acetylase RimI-like enzyme
MALEPTSDELFDRSLATLVESWRYLADGSPGAEMIEIDGAAIAVFVHSPDREFLNNAVLARGGDLAVTLDTIEHAYASRGVERYAIWVHESEAAVAREVEARGYDHDSSTRTMAMPIADLGAEVDTSMLDLVEPTLERFWALDGLDGLVPGLSTERAHFYVACSDGEDAAMLMAFDHDGDCGIYMVGTRPGARRQGLATALSAHAIKRARERGCTTASLQSTEIAESVYARVGFRDLGRFDEYVPNQSSKEKK